MTAAEYLARELSRRGVKYVFGIPGGPSIPYIEAFARSGIKFILTSSETAAAVMADVTGRITGIPGICHSTFGPGAANLATGVGGALLDRSPVIAFTSEVPDPMRNRTCQMNIDHQALFSPLTKRTFRMAPADAAKRLDEAFSIALSEYPGPVHIGLPSDLAGEEVRGSITEDRTYQEPELDVDREKLEALVKHSRKPVLALGLTARRFRIAAELQKFLELHPMPVVVTPMAKGLIPENHPCFAGVLFHAMSGKLSEVTSRADLVVGLGYDPVEYNFESWMPNVPLLSFNTVRIDMPEQLVNYQVTGELISGLNLLSAVMPGETSWEPARVMRIRSEMEAELMQCSRRFGPVSVLDILQKELPDGTILTSDVGSHLHLLGQQWVTSDPGNLLMTNGWSSMGFGLPAAIAAQLNNPGQRTVCLTGDGGFLMMLGELATARRYKLPIITVVMADRELNLIKLKQEWNGAETAAVDLYEGDLFQSDRILGIRVVRTETKEEFETAVREALKHPAPVVIEALIDPFDYSRLISPQ